jgi:hypothetical protein
MCKNIFIFVGFFNVKEEISFLKQLCNVPLKVKASLYRPR